MAAIVLGSFGTDAKRSLPALADVLETRIEADAGLQGKAAAAIWQIGPDARTLPVLIDALDIKESFVRQPVCLALSKFGPEAKAGRALPIESLGRRRSDAEKVRSGSAKEHRSGFTDSGASEVPPT